MEKEKKYTFLAVLITLFLAFSCSRSSDKDPSLTPENYQEMGLPDHTGIWDYEDYQEACVVLNNIKAIRPNSLPKKDSKKSGEVFDRMVDPDNFSFLLTDTMTLNEKAYLIQKYVDMQGCLVTAYTDLNNKEQFYNRELIDLYIFGLGISQNMLDLGQLINESVTEADVEMQYGFNSIQQLYLTMVMFILENQQKSYFFEKRDLERLSDFMYNSVSINKGWIEDAAAEDIKQQVEKIVDNTSSGEIKRSYSRLIEIL